MKKPFTEMRGTIDWSVSLLGNDITGFISCAYHHMAFPYGESAPNCLIIQH
jgi:hypothetical protein